MNERRIATIDDLLIRGFEVIKSIGDNSFNPEIVDRSLLSAITSSDMLKYNRGVIFTIDEKSREIKGEYAAGFSKVELDEILTNKISLDENNILTRTYREQKPHIRRTNGEYKRVADNDMWDDMVEETDKIAVLDVRESAAIPMKKNGLVNGIIYVDNYSPEQNKIIKSIRKRDIIILRMIAEYAASEKMKAHLYQNMKDMAETDTVTGVKTLRYVWGEWDKWRERKYDNIFVCLYDIDNLKKLNDTYGHIDCDLVLKETVGRINKVIQRENGLFGRSGGDEFVGVIYGGDQEYARSVFQESLDLVRKEPIKVTSLDCEPNVVEIVADVSFSAGFAEDYGSYKGSVHKRAIMKEADKAMYYIKTGCAKNGLAFNSGEKITKV